MILAPFLSQYRGIQAPVQELGMPARRTLPTPGLPALTETAGRSTDAAVARMRHSRKVAFQVRVSQHPGQESNCTALMRR